MTKVQGQQAGFGSSEDYYSVLGLEFGACQEDVVHAYRRLARQFHPDKNVDAGKHKDKIDEKFRAIKIAYEVLSDPNKRIIYNNYGIEGLKYMNYSLEKKIMSADEINAEFKKLQSQIIDTKINLYTRPWASFTVGLDVSELFRKPKLESLHLNDDTDLVGNVLDVGSIDNNGDSGNNDDDELEDNTTIMDYLPEINIMAANIRVRNDIADNHNMTLSGNISTRSNGTGDGTLLTSYCYQLSKKTSLMTDVMFGSRPWMSVGFKRALSSKTGLKTQSLLVLHPYGILFGGAEVTLSQVFRDNLTGKITYTEGVVTSSLKTTLIYINARLATQFTASYKLDLKNQNVAIGVDYELNRNTRLSLELCADSNDGVSVSYGCQTRVLDINVIGASMALSVPSGVTLKLRYVRATQEFNLPIYLSDEITSGPLFYGTIAPLAAYLIIERCYIRFVRPKELFSS